MLLYHSGAGEIDSDIWKKKKKYSPFLDENKCVSHEYESLLHLPQSFYFSIQHIKEHKQDNTRMYHEREKQYSCTLMQYYVPGKIKQHTTKGENILHNI